MELGKSGSAIGVLRKGIRSRCERHQSPPAPHPLLHGLPQPRLTGLSWPPSERQQMKSQGTFQLGLEPRAQPTNSKPSFTVSLLLPPLSSDKSPSPLPGSHCPPPQDDLSPLQNHSTDLAWSASHHHPPPAVRWTRPWARHQRHRGQSARDATHQGPAVCGGG